MSSYFSTIKHREWDDVSDKLKEIIFHRYFLGKQKSGRYDTKWDDETKFTIRLRKFVSGRNFNEYGDVIGKVCNYCGSMLPIEKDGVIYFRKDKKSKDGLNGRGRCCDGKQRRR
tara:strand:+ start:60 stop:401 length:342 start_codon:yes stop_codon:yes gene_type:complete